MNRHLNMQRVGGVAGILHAIAFVAGPVILAVTLSSLKLRELDMTDPTKALPAVLKAYGGFAGWAGMYVLLGASVLVLALAFDERLREDSPNLMRAATAMGIIATAFFAGAGVLNMTGLPEIAAHYSANHDQAGTAYLAFQSVSDGLLSAAVVAYGAWLVMASWAAIRAKAFSPGLSYLGFAWGIVAALAPFSADLAIFQLLGPIWAVWIGIVLLRSPATASAPVARVASRLANGRAQLPPPPGLPETSEA